MSAATIIGRPTPMRSQGKVYDTAEEAIVWWGEFAGRPDNLRFALNLIHTAAANRLTTVDHAFIPPCGTYVAVVFADDPTVIAMAVHYGYTYHHDRLLPLATISGSGRASYYSPHPTNHLRSAP